MCRRARLRQVGGQRLADFERQRHPVLPVCLAAQGDLPGAPVNVAEFQAGDLGRSEAQTCHEHQDRVILHAGDKQLESLRVSQFGKPSGLILGHVCL